MGGGRVHMVEPKAFGHFGWRLTGSLGSGAPIRAYAEAGSALGAGWNRRKAQPAGTKCCCSASCTTACFKGSLRCLPAGQRRRESWGPMGPLPLPAGQSRPALAGGGGRTPGSGFMQGRWGWGVGPLPCNGGWRLHLTMARSG